MAASLAVEDVLRRSNGQREAEIVLRTVGPTRPAVLRVPTPIKVLELRRLVAMERKLPADRLKLVLKGKTLRDADDVPMHMQDGDTLTVAVMPKPPAKHLRDVDDDEDDDLRFQMPDSASWSKKKLYFFLHDKLKLPDIFFMAIFATSLKAWACIILWFILAPVAHRWDVGPIYILVTGFLIILVNLGKKKQGDVSAYSIFNEDFRELPGTLNADRLDRDLRAGQF